MRVFFIKDSMGVGWFLVVIIISGVIFLSEKGGSFEGRCGFCFG